MKKLLLMMVSLLIIETVNAQKLVIHNQTSCDVYFYSGNVYVSGVLYNFGSETLSAAMVTANTTKYCTLLSPGIPYIPLPGFSGTQPISMGTPVAFVGFKVKTTQMDGGSYISAAAPYATSFAPYPACNGGTPYTLV